MCVYIYRVHVYIYCVYMCVCVLYSVRVYIHSVHMYVCVLHSVRVYIHSVNMYVCIIIFVCMLACISNAAHVACLCM